jgi:Bacterial Ig-like domain
MSEGWCWSELEAHRGAARPDGSENDEQSKKPGIVGANTAFFKIVGVAPAVAYNATTRVATLNPTVVLLANTTYTVRLIGGASEIRDLAGNPLTDVTWSFTTGA